MKNLYKIIVVLSILIFSFNLYGFSGEHEDRGRNENIIRELVASGIFTSVEQVNQDLMMKILIEKHPYLRILGVEQDGVITVANPPFIGVDYTTTHVNILGDQRKILQVWVATSVRKQVLIIGVNGLLLMLMDSDYNPRLPAGTDIITVIYNTRNHKMIYLYGK